MKIREDPPAVQIVYHNISFLSLYSVSCFYPSSTLLALSRSQKFFCSGFHCKISASVHWFICAHVQNLYALSSVFTTCMYGDGVGILSFLWSLYRWPCWTVFVSNVVTYRHSCVVMFFQLFIFVFSFYISIDKN